MLPEGEVCLFFGFRVSGFGFSLSHATEGVGFGLDSVLYGQGRTYNGQMHNPPGGEEVLFAEVDEGLASLFVVCELVEGSAGGGEDYILVWLGVFASSCECLLKSLRFNYPRIGV